MPGQNAGDKLVVEGEQRGVVKVTGLGDLDRCLERVGRLVLGGEEIGVPGGAVAGQDCQ